MKSVRIGFIGLGNVGGRLAGNLLQHGVDLMVRDLNEELATPEQLELRDRLAMSSVTIEMLFEDER